jgi:hypothetical protein
VAVLVGMMVKVTLVLVPVAGVEAGPVLVGEMLKVKVVSSPPQGSVSVSVVETSEVSVGSSEIVTRVTSVGVDDTSEVLLGSIEKVTRVTSVWVEEISEVLVGPREMVTRVTSVAVAETAITISETVLDDKTSGREEGKLTTSSMDESIRDQTREIIHYINIVSDPTQDWEGGK